MYEFEGLINDSEMNFNGLRRCSIHFERDTYKGDGGKHMIMNSLYVLHIIWYIYIYIYIIYKSIYGGISKIRCIGLLLKWPPSEKSVGF